MSNHRAELVAAISKAATFADQAVLVSELDAYDERLRSEAVRDRELDLAGAVVTQTLTPVRTHEMHTAATDWIADFEPVQDDTNAHHASIAEAAMWYSRVSPEVKADVEEFGVQAEGFMRREASRHGEQAQAVYDEGLAYLGFLYRRQAASGLDQIQQTVNPKEDNAPTPLPPDVFDNFAPPVSPFNDATVGTETSERAPLLQEIEQAAGGQAQPENPGGHSTDDEVSYPDQPADAATGPMNMDAIGGEGEGQPEQPDEHNERMASQRSWDGRSVAISHTMNLDDFAALQAREAASGLDQVQQTVDPHDNPVNPSPLPVQVMFPWLISPNQSNEGNEDQDPQPQGANDVANSPNPYQGTRRTAGAPEDRGSQAWPRYVHPKGSQVFVPHFMGKEKDENGNPGLNATVLAEPGQHGYEDRAEEHLMQASDGSGTPFFQHFGTRKTADMWGNSDSPHAVPGPSPANSPGTQPNEKATYQEGYKDAQSGDRPTFADASSAAPSNVSQYAKGYSDGKNAEGQGQGGNYPPQDNPVSLGGDNGQNVTNGDLNSDVSNLSAAAKVSDRFVKSASRKDPEFTKGYGYATKWTPGKPLVTLGSAEFEAGVFAGLIDRPKYQQAWVTAHRRQARKDPRFDVRMRTYSSYVEHLESKGISLVGGTSSDLDTMDTANTSPSPTGQTPINGRGEPGPLDGQQDPAAPGGPSPYNGSEPFGHQVVPSAPTPGGGGSNYVNDIPGGPADGNVNPATLAFRRQVQASLLQQSRKG